MRQGYKHRRPVIALVGPVPVGGLQLIKRSLATGCTFRLFPKMREDKSLLKKLDGADVVVTQYFTEQMAQAAGKLRLLHAVGAGVDDFCLSALSASTTVANVYFHGPAIAEYVIMAMLALSRNLVAVDSEFRKGAWQGSWISGDPPADEIKGKVLGLIGVGHIGSEVASRAKAFGMRIWALSAHPPHRRPKTIEFWAGPTRLRDLLRKSDYVVLACPLNDATRELISDQEFGWMKPSACLVNIARGRIIEEAALYRALSTRRIRGAAVDVWYRYPEFKKRSAPSRYPFHKLNNIIMTPHISGWTHQTFEQRFRTIAANIDRMASGRPLLNVLQGPTRHVSSQSSGPSTRHPQP
jgi:phosphoglycerate dehydrogenase-like enzyme